MKTVTYYSVDSTRRPTSPRYREAQHFPHHLPAEEPSFPCLRAGTLATPLSGNTLLYSCQEALPSRGPTLPTVPDSKRAPAPPLKSENSRFPTEGRKAVSCYSICSTRRPASPRYTKTQHLTLLLSTGEYHLSCPRAGIHFLH
jgi:hypothetical protein